MGQVIVRTNPLDDSEFVAHQHEGPLISLFLKTHPQGFGGPAVVMMNGRKLAPVDFDRVVGERDEVLVLIAPAVSETVLVGAVISALVSAAVNYAISWLLGSPESPDTPTTAATASPVYSLSVPTNQARLGEPIPVQYGRVLAVPDIISQPYTTYENNEMYLQMLLGLGHGDHTIHGLQAADTPVDQMQEGVFQWWSYPASRHNSQLGVIQDSLFSQQIVFYEDVYTSSEVADQDITERGGIQRYGDVSGTMLTVTDKVPVIADPGSTVLLAVDLNGHEQHTIATIDEFRDWCTLTTPSSYSGNVGCRFYSSTAKVIGPFLCCGAQQKTNKLLLDVEFPEGLYTQSLEDGSLGFLSVDIQFSATAVDEDGNVIGETGYRDVHYTASSTSPQRFTETWSGLDTQRYSVTAERLTYENLNTVDRSRAVWTALRAVLPPDQTTTETLVNYRLDTSVETTLDAWDQTNAGTVPWSLVASAPYLYGPDVTPHSTNPTFVDATQPQVQTVDGYIFRRFDVSAWSSCIDAGGGRYTAQAWTHNKDDGLDPGLLRVVCRDSGLVELDMEFTFENTYGEWESLTLPESDIPIAETIPSGTRYLDLQLYCDIDEFYPEPFTNYFDDVALQVTCGTTVAPIVPAYLDTHVVPVKIKATNGLASDATNRVAVDCTRMLNGADSVNPADALEDIYTSDSYGPGRPDSEIDQSALSALRAKWATDGREFNAVFDQRSTVWDSMGQAVRVAHAFPTLYGSTITLVEDQPATQIAVAFTVDNIAVESLSIGYRWTADDLVDGYEVEYRDATSFAPMYVLFPTTSAKPESVVLFGCTDYDTACEHAQMLWNKHLYRRKQATFKTETEGHIPLVGELISITHRLILDGSTPETYIVEAVKPAGEFAVSIEAIRYDDRVYTIGEC